MLVAFNNWENAALTKSFDKANKRMPQVKIKNPFAITIIGAQRKSHFGIFLIATVATAITARA